LFKDHKCNGFNTVVETEVGLKKAELAALAAASHQEHRPTSMGWFGSGPKSTGKKGKAPAAQPVVA
jgi:hypothetical protein